MLSNFFLTGERRAGKTTMITCLLRKLNLDPGGFMIGRRGKIPYYTGFYIAPARPFILNRYNKKKAKEEGLFFAYRDGFMSPWQVDNEVLNKKGVSFLEQDGNITIMDELGRFELKAEKFKKKIEQVLNRPDRLVLGVIKDESNPFLNKIRKREDVKMFAVNKHNRKKILNAIYIEIKINYLSLYGLKMT